MVNETHFFFFMVYENITQAKTENIKRALLESSSESEHETNENFYQFILFTNPSARAGYDTRSIFKQSLTGLNSEFSFS